MVPPRSPGVSSPAPDRVSTRPQNGSWLASSLARGDPVGRLPALIGWLPFLSQPPDLGPIHLPLSNAEDAGDVEAAGLFFLPASAGGPM